MLRIILGIIFLLAGFIGLGMTDQVKVNIFYPINGANYPITDPSCKSKVAYITAGFSVTCSGGPHKVKWGFDDHTCGKSIFYDQTNIEFVNKLSYGSHIFWVISDCGENKVKFTIGR